MRSISSRRELRLGGYESLPRTKGTTMKQELILEAYRRYGWKCVYCGLDGSKSHDAWSRGRFNLDHWIPRSWGGTDAIENLRSACGACNSAKAENVFPSLKQAQRWLRLYYAECSRSWHETFVTQTAASYEENGLERVRRRYNYGDDVQ
jgi:HNH endonuclease